MITKMSQSPNGQTQHLATKPRPCRAFSLLNLRPSAVPRNNNVTSYGEAVKILEKLSVETYFKQVLACFGSVVQRKHDATGFESAFIGILVQFFRNIFHGMLQPHSEMGQIICRHKVAIELDAWAWAWVISPSLPLSA